MADYIKNERNVLDRLHHPGIAQLQFTFQVGLASSRSCPTAAAAAAAAAAACLGSCKAATVMQQQQQQQQHGCT
jgi:mevalonate pyrophosphate decarboxylase